MLGAQKIIKIIGNFTYSMIRPQVYTYAPMIITYCVSYHII